MKTGKTAFHKFCSESTVTYTIWKTSRRFSSLWMLMWSSSLLNSDSRRNFNTIKSQNDVYLWWRWEWCRYLQFWSLLQRLEAIKWTTSSICNSDLNSRYNTGTILVEIGKGIGPETLELFVPIETILECATTISRLLTLLTNHFH